MVLRNKILALLVFAFTAQITFGQISELNLSQFFNAPLLYNPAEAGNFDGKCRSTALYGDQWGTWNTMTASYEYKFGKKQNHFNLGLGVFQDQTRLGDQNIGTAISGRLTLAYEMNWADKKLIIAGQPVFSMANLDLGGLTQPDAFNPATGIYDNPTTETFANPSVQVPNANVGVSYSQDLAGTKIHGGLYLANVIRGDLANISFIDDTAYLPRKFGFNGSADFHLSGPFHMEPQFLLERKIGTQETKLNVAIVGRYETGSTKSFSAARAGVLAKTAFDINNVSAFVGLEYQENVFFNVSYDFNASPRTISDVNGIELSLIYICKNKVKVQKIRKVCPRF